MQDYPKYSPCVILPKVAKQPQKQISHLWPKPRIIKFAILPPDQSYIFGLLLINTSLNTTVGTHFAAQAQDVWDLGPVNPVQ